METLGDVRGAPFGCEHAENLDLAAGQLQRPCIQCVSRHNRPRTRRGFRTGRLRLSVRRTDEVHEEVVVRSCPAQLDQADRRRDATMQT